LEHGGSICSRDKRYKWAEVGAVVSQARKIFDIRDLNFFSGLRTCGPATIAVGGFKRAEEDFARVARKGRARVETGIFDDYKPLSAIHHTRMATNWLIKGKRKKQLTVNNLITGISTPIRHLPVLDLKAMVPRKAIEPVLRCIVTDVPTGLSTTVKRPLQPARNCPRDLKVYGLLDLGRRVKTEDEGRNSFGCCTPRLDGSERFGLGESN
jgi:hypothetical protein